jgi:hypothetical protein
MKDDLNCKEQNELQLLFGSNAKSFYPEKKEQ